MNLVVIEALYCLLRKGNFCMTTYLCKNRLRWKSFAVAKLNFNSLENIRGWTIVLHEQGLLHRLFHWKGFVITDQSMKTTNFSTSNDLQYTCNGIY